MQLASNAINMLFGGVGALFDVREKLKVCCQRKKFSLQKRNFINVRNPQWRNNICVNIWHNNIMANSQAHFDS